MQLEALFRARMSPGFEPVSSASRMDRFSTAGTRDEIDVDIVVVVAVVIEPVVAQTLDADGNGFESL